MADLLASLIRPDRGPSLPSLDRFAPPPPMNLVVAEIEARSSPGGVAPAPPRPPPRAAAPGGGVGRRQALKELFSSRCSTCERMVVVDEFIWEGGAPAPFRKIYRCPACRDQIGGGGGRSVPVDEADRERARAAAAGAAAPAP